MDSSCQAHRGQAQQSWTFHGRNHHPRTPSKHRNSLPDPTQGSGTSSASIPLLPPYNQVKPSTTGPICAYRTGTTAQLITVSLLQQEPVMVTTIDTALTKKKYNYLVFQYYKLSTIKTFCTKILLAL